MQENYGDVHLHYNQYPEDGQYGYSSSCKWDATGRAPYEALEMPAPEPKCATEYCHPGSWQGKCGSGDRSDRPQGCGRVVSNAQMVDAVKRQMVEQAVAQHQQQVHLMGGVAVDYSTLYLSILALFALVGFYLLKRK